MLSSRHFIPLSDPCVSVQHASMIPVGCPDDAQPLDFIKNPWNSAAPLREETTSPSVFLMAAHLPEKKMKKTNILLIEMIKTSLRASPHGIAPSQGSLVAQGAHRAPTAGRERPNHGGTKETKRHGEEGVGHPGGASDPLGPSGGCPSRPLTPVSHVYRMHKLNDGVSRTETLCFEECRWDRVFVFFPATGVYQVQPSLCEKKK